MVTRHVTCSEFLCIDSTPPHRCPCRLRVLLHVCLAPHLVLLLLLHVCPLLLHVDLLCVDRLRLQLRLLPCVLLLLQEVGLMLA